jgi:3-oxosteroid 1-dehydrogenase
MSKSMNESDFDEVFDFVVVGSGGGSMCAALVLRSLGKSVVVLEKTDLVGGTTATSGGVMWIPNNRFMKEAGVEDSGEKAAAYLEATAGQSVDAPGTSAQRRVAYVDEAPKMIDFLVDQGIRLRRIESWPDYYDERQGGSAPGRTVIADLFDVNELGDWKQKLRPNFMAIPAYHSEAFAISTMRSSWQGKLTLIKVICRMVFSKFRGKQLVTFGSALQGRMLQRALQAGTDIRVNNRVKSFILRDGIVQGVVVEAQGRERRIGGRLGVLVNAGGFARNQEMRDKYMPGTSSHWTAAAAGDTGEILTELMALGAAAGQLNEFIGNQVSIPPGRENGPGKEMNLSTTSGQMDFAKPHSMVIDQTGLRYMNEAGSYVEFCRNMLARNESIPAVPSWWIFDQQFIQKYMIGGTMPGSKKPQSWYDSGYLKRANTIDELADLTHIDPAVLKASIDRFNAGARIGRDDEFKRGQRAYDEWLGDHHHRPAQTLGPIEQPPFYAAPVVPGDVGTFGGVVTDAVARVLREDGTPIKGLYATGTTTASVMGRVYPGAGSSIGPSFVWGYVAAKHAVGDGGVG